MQVNMPSCYIQEKGAIHKLGTHFKHLMDEGVSVIMDEFSFSNLRQIVEASLKKEHINYTIECLKGECCEKNINALVNNIKHHECKCVVGIGGGKALDVAKAVGYFAQIPSIMVPTAASTDGPCSKLFVLYEEDGTFKEYVYMSNNPYGILVDTEIIANAPVRLLKAGIGDALSTYFETEAGYQGELERGGRSSISQMARIISKRCFEIILDKGKKAIEAVENKKVNEALEQIIEAIIYMSCIGFENGALAAAHSVCNALSSQTQYNHLLHGEKVAFGTMVQLILEEQPWELVSKVRDFSREIGLPYCMKDIGLQVREIEKIAGLVCKEDQPIHQMRGIFAEVGQVQSAILFTQKL